MERLNQKIFRWATSLLLLLYFLDSRSTQANEWHFEAGGSLKSFGILESLRQKGLYRENLVPHSEERLRLQGALSNGFLRFEIANETFFYARSFNPPVHPIPDFSPKSWWTPKWTLVETRNIEAINRFDRAFIQLDFGSLKTILGKQVIPIGVGQIFNAVSQMQRYPLIFIDPEFPKTEDALTVLWTNRTQIEARYLPKNPGQQQDNFHFRIKGSLNGADWALTSGRSDDKAFLGAESAFNLKEALMRLELVSYFFKGRQYLQGLAGLDYVFSSTWSSKWEFFYNGFENPALHRSAPFRGTFYFGNLTTWEIHPLLKANLISILNLKDPSLLLHGFFNYSLSDSVDLLMGQFLGIGTGTSEFGGKIPLTPATFLGQPDITYAALRWYF